MLFYPALSPSQAPLKSSHPAGKERGEPWASQKEPAAETDVEWVESEAELAARPRQLLAALRTE